MVEKHGRILAVFPGVPWEMEEMLERDLVPEIAGWSPGLAKITRTLLLGGVVEIGHRGEDPPPLRSVRSRERDDPCLLRRAPPGADGRGRRGRRPTKRLDAMEAAFREVLGDDVAGVDVDGPAEVVLEGLREGAGRLWPLPSPVPVV